MASTPFQSPARKSLTLSLTWLLTAGLCAITVENIWLDPWLKAKFPNFHSLAPEPPSAFWLVTFAVIGIVCVVLIVGQILLMRRAGVPRNTKIVAGITVAAAVLLSIVWFLVTSGISAAPRLLSLHPPHSVKLTWNASTTPGVGYYIYRVKLSTGEEKKLNGGKPIYALTYTDTSVENGEKYVYYVTSVLGANNESSRSLPAYATIPTSQLNTSASQPATIPASLPYFNASWA